MKWLSGLAKRNEMLRDLIYDLWERQRNVIVLGRFIDQLEELKRLLIAKGVPEDDLGQYTRTQNGKRVGQGYLDKMKERRVLLATYGMAKEGFDCPRLDAGVEATPQADNVQGIGRIRRPFPGKPDPIWFTIRDLNANLFERYTRARLLGYEKHNVDIQT
jgi:superfamily II DNA or RNA helicase